MPMYHKFFQYGPLLYNYDIFPKVLVTGKESRIHVRSIGGDIFFWPGQSYKLMISEMTAGDPAYFPETANFKTYTVKAEKQGEIEFVHTFPNEGEYKIHFSNETSGGDEFAISVYAVDADLAGRYPFLGDLHLHSRCSDGWQLPEEVAAKYHMHGMDFIVISDHERYYPSLRAINYYKDLNTEFLIVPGEEIHPQPVNKQYPGFHMVNFGGSYSVNALVEGCQTSEVGTDPATRSTDGNCPPTMTHEEYERIILERAQKMDIPDNVSKTGAASFAWAAENVKAGNGLVIFPHPYWVLGATYNVSDTFVRYLVDNELFDAFEVLGGEIYYEQNGYQAAMYYEDRANGKDYPVVGSTDSHNANEESERAMICSTIVLSPENTTKALIDSIKGKYSVAVGTLTEMPHLVGSFRLIRYCNYLLAHYFPIHDEYCFESGRMMHQHFTGSAEEKAEAEKMLAMMNGRLARLRKKYFDFD